MQLNCLKFLVGVVAIFSLAWLAPAALGQTVTQEGFKVELVYQPPEIEHPSVVTCDDEGNLFVGEDPMDMRGPTTKHFDRVILIRWDKETGKPIRTVFCEDLGAVFGLVWHDDALYVMHAPLYSVFRDTNGDGVADERKDLAEGFGPPAGVYGFNDHIVTGTRLGMDGFIYVSVGDKGIPKATGADGSTITLEGGGVVRMRPDGTRLEVVTSGTRNHLDVAMDSLDNIFTYDNTDDGLGWWTRFTHHVPTGYYGYPYDYHPHPDRHLPRISEHGGGSPVGAACYNEAYWPEKYRNAAFHCEWGKGKIQVFYPKREGATFTATMEDFMIKDPKSQEEFRPQDLCFSPDGKHMYVADWNFGGWVNKKVCGRLYRVTYVGGNVTPEPARIAKDASVEQLMKGLGHPSHAQRMQAQWRIGKHVQDARTAADVIKQLSPLLSNGDLDKWTKIHTIWTLNDIAERQPGLDPSAWYYVLAMQGHDADVRAQAARAIGTRAGRGEPALRKISGDALKQVIKDRDASVRMYAAISLGRLGDEANADALFAALGEQDQFARFTMVQALRTLSNWKDAQKYLDSDNQTQRAATLLGLTNQYDDEAVAALAWAVNNAKHEDVRAGAVAAIAEVSRKADPYEKGWWGTQPARGKPSRPKVHDWSGTSTVLTTVRGALRHQDDLVRKAAMAALVDLNDPESLPIVVQMASDGSLDDQIRIDAIRTLLAAKSAEAGKLAAQIAADEKSSKALLLESLEALRVSASNDSAKAIEKLLTRDDPAIRSKALEALVVAAGPSSAPQIIAAVKDADANVRKTAIRVAGEAGLRETIPTLIEVASQADVEFEAANALAAMPDRRAVGAYVQALGSKNNDLRKKAREALISIKSAIGEDIIQRHQRSELSPEQRRELQGVFSAPTVIREWQLVGGFPKDQGEPKFDAAQAPDAEQTFEVNGAKLRWKRVTTQDANGKISPAQHVDPDNQVWSLAYAEIESSTEQQSEFVIGSDDQAKLWVNGEKIYEFNNNRGWSAEADRGGLKLKQGVNRIYLLCGNDGGPWDFSLGIRLKDPQYAFLYENTPAQLDTSVYRQHGLTSKGDAERGRTLFFDVKGVGCAKCHAVGEQGAKVGPNLTGIGSKYPREELVRSILEPSARVAESFQVTVVLTGDGKVLQGLVKTDTPESLELIDAEGKALTIATDEIEERKQSNLSLMPNGLKDGLTLNDFADIVAYLESLKESK
jgi:putative membrane-bound dehydrogenase-like protein